MEHLKGILGTPASVFCSLVRGWNTWACSSLDQVLPRLAGSVPGSGTYKKVFFSMLFGLLHLVRLEKRDALLLFFVGNRLPFVHYQYSLIPVYFLFRNMTIF